MSIHNETVHYNQMRGYILLPTLAVALIFILVVVVVVATAALADAVVVVIVDDEEKLRPRIIHG